MTSLLKMNIKIINQYTYTIRGVWSEMFDSTVLENPLKYNQH